jgi:hypothetical protein
VTQETTPVCELCRFWSAPTQARDEGVGRWGRCLRYPPTITGGRTEWPRTYGYEWCGEFHEGSQ